MNIKEKILVFLEKVRPSLQMDGGDIEFVNFNEVTGALEVQLTGHCAHCPMSSITLKDGIETEIKKEIPEVKRVDNVLSI